MGYLAFHNSSLRDNRTTKIFLVNLFFPAQFYEEYWLKVSNIFKEEARSFLTYIKVPLGTADGILSHLFPPYSGSYFYIPLYFARLIFKPLKAVQFYIAQISDFQNVGMAYTAVPKWRTIPTSPQPMHQKEQLMGGGGGGTGVYSYPFQHFQTVGMAYTAVPKWRTIPTSPPPMHQKEQLMGGGGGGLLLPLPP